MSVATETRRLASASGAAQRWKRKTSRRWCRGSSGPTRKPSASDWKQASIASLPPPPHYYDPLSPPSPYLHLSFSTPSTANVNHSWYICNCLLFACQFFAINNWFVRAGRQLPLRGRLSRFFWAFSVGPSSRFKLTLKLAAHTKLHRPHVAHSVPRPSPFFQVLMGCAHRREGREGGRSF